MAGLTWQRPPQRAFAELSDAYVQAIRRGIFAVCQRYTPEIENWMKAQAPWTDRTGNARQTLWSDVEQVSESMVQVIMAHGVDYGIFLELKNAGRFAVVNPALDEFGPRIWADIVRMVRAQ